MPILIYLLMERKRGDKAAPRTTSPLKERSKTMQTFVKLKDYKNQPIYVNINAIRTMRKIVVDGFIGTSIALPEKEIFVRGTPEDVLVSIAAIKDR